LIDDRAFFAAAESADRRATLFFEIFAFFPLALQWITLDEKIRTRFAYHHFTFAQ